MGQEFTAEAGWVNTGDYIVRREHPEHPYFAGWAFDHPRWEADRTSAKVLTHTIALGTAAHLEGRYRVPDVSIEEVTSERAPPR